MKAGFKIGQKLTLFQVGELRALADNGYDVRVSLARGGFRLDYLHRVLPGGKADGYAKALSPREMAKALGSLGGKANTKPQNDARRLNGLLGGRPRTKSLVRQA